MSLSLARVSPQRDRTPAVSLQSTLQRGAMGKLLDALDQIKAALADVSVELTFPQVIVCGQESSGKSSVVERICMFPFFPRGRGVTTRAPICLRLHRASSEEMKGFAAHCSKRYHPDGSYLRVAAEGHEEAEGGYLDPRDSAQDHEHVVRRCQDFVMTKLKEQQAIKDGHVMREAPIRLDAWGERCLDLELVDLPGVFAAWTEGEQPDVVEVTKKITRSYLLKPNTIPVVVVNATATSVRNNVGLQMIGFLRRMCALQSSRRHIFNELPLHSETFHVELGDAPCAPVLALVCSVEQETDKTDVAICALTFSDRCSHPEHNSSDPFEELKERARGTAGDCPRLGGGFVALKNRDTRMQQKSTLAQGAASETQWFREKMPDLVESGHATAPCLIDRISKQMVEFTVNNWAPATIRLLEAKRDELLKKVEALGAAPASDLITQIMEHCDDVVRAVIRRHDVLQVSNVRIASRSPSKSGDPLDFAVRWAKACRGLRDRPTSTIERIVKRLREEAAAECKRDQALPLRFSRFHRARELLVEAVSTQVKARKAPLQERWEKDLPVLLVSLNAKETRTLAELQARATSLLRNIVLEEVGVPLWSLRCSSLVTPGPDMLSEDCAEERQNLNQGLDSIARALTLIHGLPTEYQ